MHTPLRLTRKKYNVTIKNSFLTQIPQLLDRLGISYPIFWNIIINGLCKYFIDIKITAHDVSFCQSGD